MSPASLTRLAATYYPQIFWHSTCWTRLRSFWLNSHVCSPVSRSLFLSLQRHVNSVSCSSRIRVRFSVISVVFSFKILDSPNTDASALKVWKPNLETVYRYCHRKAGKRALAPGFEQSNSFESSKAENSLVPLQQRRSGVVYVGKRLHESESITITLLTTFVSLLTLGS